jgi:uncharacterized protein (DUF697 family)
MSTEDKAWGDPVSAVEVDFELENGKTLGVDLLITTLSQLLPVLTQLDMDEAYSNSEERNFAALKQEALWYSAAAGATDAFPAIGVVSVPMIQTKMLHSLANQYGMDWSKKTMSDFVGALGASFVVQYGVRLGLRQLIKFIPVYGQTIGSATAAVVSFCSTFAIGRVACKYMYHKSKGESVSNEELMDMYRSAFDSVKEVANHASN